MKTLIIECGAAETRGALLADGEAQKFFFAPARGDEHLPRPAETGEIFLGRVKSIVKSINGAFVDIDEPQEGFIPFTDKIDRPDEGAAVVVRVRRPALGGKGAVLTMDWRKGLTSDEVQTIETRAAETKPGARLNPPVDAALQIAKRATDAGVRYGQR